MSGRLRPATRRIPSLLALALILAVSACVSGPQPRRASGPGVIGPTTLGQSPLCEASAALAAPWDPEQILVADNEISDRLFVFRQDADGILYETGIVDIASPAPPDDLEALAAFNDHLVIVGSHGRGGSCTPKTRRQRIMLLVPGRDETQLDVAHGLDNAPHWLEYSDTAEACLSAYFTPPYPEHAPEFCAALVEAEHPEPGGNCRSFDIEAAASVLDRDGRQRLWLGLRQPRIGGRAVLLRLDREFETLHFDRVVLIDAARGVRGLQSHAGRLWAILGPTAPSFATSCLWSTPLESLETQTIIDGRIAIYGLPPASEGMVFGPRTVTFVIDGDESPEGSDACETPARQIVVPLDTRRR